MKTSLFLIIHGIWSAQRDQKSSAVSVTDTLAALWGLWQLLWGYISVWQWPIGPLYKPGSTQRTCRYSPIWGTRTSPLSKWVWVYFLLIPWCHNTGIKYTFVELKHHTCQNSRTKEVLALPEIENDISEARCRWKQPVRRGDAAQGRVSSHALKIIRHVTCW